jgi:hypothetical protein
MIHDISRQSQPKNPSGVADPRAWLEHITAQRRGVVANWFHSAVRSGAASATLVLLAVRQTCERRQDADSLLVLGALRADPVGAMQYAQAVIDYERLPAAQRQQIKADRAREFVHEAMHGKPPTAPQLAYLTRLGYRGEPPADRVEASALIAHLRQTGGGQ